MSEVPSTADPRSVLQGWRDELASLGGLDSLLFYRDHPEGTLDLGHAHPNGVAGFLAGRPTRLSSLFREADAMDTARRRARAVSIAGSRLTDEHGLPGTHLAVGMVHWESTPTGLRDVMAPVLLRPITLVPKGIGAADHELDLHGQAWMNPALMRLLADSGVVLDQHALARLAHGSHGFTPRRVLDRLADETRNLPGFSVFDRVVVGTFVDLAPGLITALEEAQDQLAAHPVVRALAAAGDGDGAATAAWAAAGGAARPDEEERSGANPFARDWSGAPTPKGVPVSVFPLDQDQREAVAVAARSDVAVMAPPGTGATQVAAQMIVQAAESGESVLVVAPRRGELMQVHERLGQYGLHLLTDEGARANHLPPAAPMAPIPNPAPRRALHQIHEKWQLSLLEVLRIVARRMTSPPVATDQPDPETGADDEAGASRREPERLPDLRMEEPALSALVGLARYRAVDLLREGVDTGAFKVSARDTPWFGADVTTADDANFARELVDRLTNTGLPELSAAMENVQNSVGLKPRDTLNGWLSQLGLLTSVRDTLSVFGQHVYETTLDDMIVATATPEWRTQHGSNMSLLDRRRLRKTARELVRPGASPGDLHAGLVRAHDEGRRWTRLCPGGGRPHVPNGLDELEQAADVVVDDVAELSRVLAGTQWLADGLDLMEMPVTQLRTRLAQLDGATDSLTALPQQMRVRNQVQELGLEQYAQALSKFDDVPPTLPDDIETQWAAGVLREMLAEAQSVQDQPVPDPRPDEIAWLRQQTSGREQHMAMLATALSVPYKLSPGQRVDRVILLGAHRLGLAESVLSVVRGRRLAVIGDPAGTRPTGLELGDADIAPSRPRRSVLDAATAALPTVALRFTHRGPAQLVDAAEQVMAAGGDVPLAATPRYRVAAPPDERRLLLQEVAEGRTAPSWEIGDDGPVEAPDTEVRRVVDLVLHHAAEQAEIEGFGGRGETLGVITLTRAHARRVADMLRLRLRQRPELTEWLIRPGAEAFVITDIARAEDVTRDHVIFSVGLGLTPHGKVLHRFGPLDDVDGARMLRSAISRSRQRVTVVTCIDASALDTSRGLTPGAHGLRRLLELARSGAPGGPMDDVGEPDPVLGLLVEELRAHPATVQVTCVDGWPPPPPGEPVNTAFSSSPAVPDLVVIPDPSTALSPDGLEVVHLGTPVAVLWDGRTPGVDPAVAVERDARLATTLTQLGWQVVHVDALDVVRARKAVARAILS